MRKIAAIICSGMLTACAAADLPATNPCAQFEQIYAVRENRSALDRFLGTLSLDDGEATIGEIFVPSVTMFGGVDFIAKMGIREPLDMFDWRGNVSFAEIPNANGMIFIKTYAGTLNCLDYDLFFLRDGKATFVSEDDDGKAMRADVCDGESYEGLRPIVMSGRPYVVQIWEDERNKMGWVPRNFQFFPIVDGKVSINDVCTYTYFD